MQEYVRVGVQGPAYLGFRPTDGLSVEFERWAKKCRIASVRHSLTRCTPPWRSVRVVNTTAPLQGRLIYSNSRVHGNMTLYAEAGSYHYKLLLLLNCMVPGFLPRWDVEEVISEALLITTTYYYTMLQQLLLHCYFMLYINCCLFSSCASRLVGRC